MVRHLDGAVHGAIVCLELRGVQYVVDAIVQLVAVVANTRTIATADVCIIELFLQLLAGVGDGRVIEITAYDNVRRGLLLEVSHNDFRLVGTLGGRVAKLLHQFFGLLAS